MKKEKQNQKRNKKQNLKAYKGITLIALVVTIVVLLILAAISITALFGDNGLITRANNAKTKTDEGAASDINAIENLNSRINEIVNGTTEGGSEENPPTPPAPEKTRIEELMETAATDNETVLDKYGNKIRIPAGFKIVEHGTKENDNNMVEYTYDKVDGTSTNIPVVQDGIVIKNEADGNEFVWVPVGEIKNDAALNTTNKTTITLGRYSDYTMPSSGTPTPAQVASKTAYDTPTPIDDSYDSSKHIEISSNFVGGTFGGTTYKAAGEYKDSRGKTNTKSTNLQEWISTTIDNGGYYIARFEASKNGDKAASKVSTGTPASTGGTVNNGMLWNNITQPDAATASKAMYPYSEGAKYYSDLINSYAWDTAIIFIEAYSGDIDYASQDGKSINPNLANTGVNTDKKCNIHDMAGNVLEWTTETCTNSSLPCTSRGGYCGYSYDYASYRNSNGTSHSNNYISFRPSLCVK